MPNSRKTPLEGTNKKTTRRKKWNNRSKNNRNNFSSGQNGVNIPDEKQLDRGSEKDTQVTNISTPILDNVDLSENRTSATIYQNTLSSIQANENNMQVSLFKPVAARRGKQKRLTAYGSKKDTSLSCTGNTSKKCQDVVPYNKAMAELQEKLYGAICFCCQKKIYFAKYRCGCGRATYCSDGCKAEDKKRHRQICKRMSKFDAANAEIQPRLREILFGKLGYKGIRYILGCVPPVGTWDTYVPRFCVLVEIIDTELGIFHFKIRVKDAANQTTDVIYRGVPKNYMQALKIARFTQSLAPGNFLLLINGQWNISNTPGISCVLIEDIDDIEAVDMGHRASWYSLAPVLFQPRLPILF